MTEAEVLKRRRWIGLERAVPPDAAAGERYPSQQMAILDSERG
jgi:hypothetical protein